MDIKIMLKALSCVLLCSMGVACSKKSELESIPGLDKPSKTVLTYMSSSDWVQDPELDLARKFDDENGIGINYQIFPPDQYNNLLMTKLNTGEATDIYAAQSGSFDLSSQLDVSKNAVDLSHENWADNVEDFAAQELIVDGRLYGQPIQDVSAVWAVAYNKQIFRELDLAIPDSYAAFLSICETIQSAGITPIYECVSSGWHHTLWFMETSVAIETQQPGFADLLNQNSAFFESNEMFVLILEQMMEMVDRGYWGDRYFSNTYEATAESIASGEYAMTVYNQGLGGEVNRLNPDIDMNDIGYFVIPLADNQTLNVNPSGPARFVYSNSNNQEEAKLYLDFLATTESLTYLTEQVPKYNQLPYKNVSNSYSEAITEFYDRYTQSNTVYQTAVKYVNPQWVSIGDDIKNMLAGEISAVDVLERIDQRRTAQAQLAGDKLWE